MSKHTEELNKEIEELEKAMTGEPTVEKPTTLAESLEVSPPAEPGLSEPEKKPQRTNWKQRYTKLRSHHDSLVFDLRSELAATKERGVKLSTDNMELSDKLKDLSSKAAVEDTSYFTTEERDVLGEDAISALTKATRKMTDQAINPLQEQLNKERTLRIEMEKKEATQAKAAVVNTFLSKLGTLVPNFAEMDIDPAFGAWMEEQDPVSGYTRKQLFKRAEANGDVGRVAGFFTEFKRREDPLAEHVTPTGTTTSVQTQLISEDSKVISRAYVDNFYNKAARGEFKNNMSAFRKEEALIDKAAMEGRIK